MEKLLELRKFFHCFFRAGVKNWLQLTLNSFLPTNSFLLSTIYWIFTKFPVLLENEHLKRLNLPTANRAAINTRPAGEPSLYLIGPSHTSSTSVSPAAEEFPPAWGGAHSQESMSLHTQSGLGSLAQCRAATAHPFQDKNLFLLPVT